jgi:hypothetical protein
VENQPIELTISASEGHTIESTEFTFNVDIPIKVNQQDSNHYSLIIPHAYKEQILALKTTATNNEGEVKTIESSLELKFNQPPKLSLVTQFPVNNDVPFLLEFNVEDEHALKLITLSTEHAEVIIEQVNETSFLITLPESFSERGLIIEATSADEFHAINKQNFYINFLSFYSTYLTTRGFNTAFLNYQGFVKVNIHNQPEESSIKEILWQQLSGPELKLEETNSEYLNFLTPSEYSADLITLEAKVTLSDDSFYTIGHQIQLIEDRAYSLTLLDVELVEANSSNKNVRDMDANSDGLEDLITIEKGIAYIQLQNNDGSYAEKLTVGEVTFHQWLRNGPIPEMQLPLPENLRISSIQMKDVDNDGIIDVVFTGGIHYPLAAITDPVAGWLKGIGEGKYYGDFINVGLGYSVGDSFEDINQDGTIDWLYYDAYTELSGPFINLSFGVLPKYSVSSGSPTYLPRLMHLFDAAYDFPNNSENYTVLQLYTTQAPWEYGSGESDNHERLAVNEFLPEANKFNIGYSLLLNERTLRVHFIDVTNDNKRDIVIKTTDGNYFLVILEQ